MNWSLLSHDASLRVLRIRLYSFGHHIESFDYGTVLVNKNFEDTPCAPLVITGVYIDSVTLSYM